MNRSSLHKGGEAIPEQVCCLRGVSLSVLESSKETEWLECGWRGGEKKLGGEDKGKQAGTKEGPTA